MVKWFTLFSEILLKTMLTAAIFLANPATRSRIPGMKN
jgi:hypothetical protein